MSFKVAVDGPAGSGKSTLVRGLAKKYGFHYLDTGAMYRACGLFLLDNGIDLTDTDSIGRALADMEMRVEFGDGGQRVFVNDTDYTPFLRTPAGDKASGAAGKVAAIREKLVALQQSIAAGRDVVMDGRDIGTRVLPDADVKILLTADRDIRVRRRAGELAQKGVNRRADEVKAEIEARDYDDTHRANSPLKAADDAVVLDTSGMSAEEALAFVSAIIDSKLGK